MLKDYEKLGEQALQHQVEATNVMLKLRDRQPEDERGRLVQCKPE